jgi:hypothetical protein
MAQSSRRSGTIPPQHDRGGKRKGQTMCSVSMVMDHRYDEWGRRLIQPNTWPAQIPFHPTPPTQDEIDEFRRLLDRAREYDKRMNQPDCELDEKRNRLLDLAKQLGVEISFL